MRVVITLDVPDSQDYTAEDVMDALEERLDCDLPLYNGVEVLPENVRVSMRD